MERDIRRLLNVGDLRTFTTFLRLGEDKVASRRLVFGGAGAGPRGSAEIVGWRDLQWIAWD